MQKISYLSNTILFLKFTYLVFGMSRCFTKNKNKHFWWLKKSACDELGMRLCSTVFFLRYTHHRLRFPVCFLCYTTPPLTLFSSARFYGVIKLVSMLMD